MFDFLKKMPEDDIARKIIKKIKNNRIEVDRQVLVSELDNRTTRTWDYNFTVGDLKSNVKVSLSYKTGELKLKIDYKLTVDNLLMRCKKKYVRRLVNILDDKWIKLQDEDNELIRKDIRNILNQN